MNLAVIETGGKQYLVSEGQKIKVEKLSVEENGAIIFDKVLLVFDGKKTTLGKPLIKGASVEAKLTKTGRNRKVIVFRYHSKTRYRKKKGHRQYFTEVEIGKIKE
ncbi:MAG: 50S ribosomal protein L21 [bacterium]|nr:50S ribosomal protein L21 [bacterium]